MAGELSDDRTGIDRYLLANVRGSSVAELAEATGLEVDAVAERVANLLNSKGVLEDLYEERLIIEKIKELYKTGQDRLENVSDKYLSGLLNALLKSLTVQLAELDKRRRRVNSDELRIKEHHAEIMGRALGEAFLKFIKGMNIDEEEAMIVMEEVLPDAFAIIEDNTEGR